MTSAVIRSAPLLAGVLVLSGTPGIPEEPFCEMPAGPEYYAFELVGTNRIPGTGAARGRVDVSVPASSPFSVALTPDGSYQYELHITLERMRRPREGVLVAWVSDTNLDTVHRIGPLDQHSQATGFTSWNKFIVIITLEPADDAAASRWSGPVVFRGMSRSGMMHTMVGHGALQQENCAAYGYDE